MLPLWSGDMKTHNLTPSHASWRTAGLRIKASESLSLSVNLSDFLIAFSVRHKEGQTLHSFCLAPQKYTLLPPVETGVGCRSCKCDHRVPMLTRHWSQRRWSRLLDTSSLHCMQRQHFTVTLRAEPATPENLHSAVLSYNALYSACIKKKNLSSVSALEMVILIL